MPSEDNPGGFKSKQRVYDQNPGKWKRERGFINRHPYHTNHKQSNQLSHLRTSQNLNNTKDLIKVGQSEKLPLFSEK